MTQINLSAAATWPGIDNEMDRNEMNNTKRKKSAQVRFYSVLLANHPQKNLGNGPDGVVDSEVVENNFESDVEGVVTEKALYAGSFFILFGEVFTRGQLEYRGN